MSKRTTQTGAGLCSLLLLLFMAPFQSFSQSSLSADFDAGYLFFMGDVTGKEKPADRPNIALTPAINWEFYESFSLQGRLTYALVSGRNDVMFYEGTIFEPSVMLGWNLLPLFGYEGNGRLKLQAGAGWLYFFSTKYRMPSGEYAVRVPVDGGYNSHTALGMVGLTGTIPITEKLGLNIGYIQRYNFDNGWIDVYNPDDNGDHYGIATLGLNFNLRSDVHKDETKVKTATYQALLKEKAELESANDSLKNVATANKDTYQAQIVAQEKMIDAQRDTISDLTERIDSVSKNIRVVRGPAKKGAPTVERKDMGPAQWRVVIGSFKSYNNAQNYVKQVLKDRPGIEIVHYEDLNLYRVVYASFDQLPAAKKALLNARQINPEAWIVKF